jgi:O-antigen/teichoic acid export membrane protein
MRTVSSIRNIAASTLSSLLTIVIGFFAQRIFVQYLGLEYLGLNGLFLNIVSMLAVVELGVGLAITYSLYKPLAHGDTSTVKSLMQFYKKCYRFIAIIVAAIGLVIMPFLGIIVGDVSIQESIYFIYGLFLLDVILSYLLTYKRSILYADQKNYIVNTVHTGYTVTVNILQIVILVLTANFILYLLIKIGMRVIENVILNTIVSKRYPLLKEKNIAPLDNDIKQDIFKKTRALFFHKIASFVVLGSDNIIISVFLGITTVGLYANYFLVLSAVSTLVSQVFSAITASVGNLLVTSTAEKSHEVYRRVRFANFWLAAFVSIGLLVSMDSFVKVWIGEQFILPLGVLIALAINLYLNLFRSALGSFKEAAAIFHEDRFVPIVESIVNIVAAIVLLYFFGLAGVFMGTICSNFVLHLFSYPRYVYTKLFKRSYAEYYREFSSYLIVALLVGVITFGISRMVIVENSILQLVTNVTISLVVPNVLFYVLYRKSDEFNYFEVLVGKMIRKLRKR